jgi:mannose-6-phosphate isomerase-like protein (cupin superfamily)
MYKTNIEEKTLSNSYFRKVLYTNKQMQLVVMSLQPKEEIGMEVHKGSQFIRVESGNGIAIINDKRYILKEDYSIVIDAGSRHNIIAGKNGMKLYSIYTPPEHKDGTIHKYKPS